MQPVPQASPAMVLMFLGVVSAILISWGIAAVVLSQRAALLPRETRRVVPWGPVSVFAVVVLYVVMMLLVRVGYEVINPSIPGKPPIPLPLRDTLLLSGIASLAMIYLTPLLLKMTSGARLADLGLTTRDFGKNLARGVWFCFLAMPLVYGVSIAASLTVKRDKHPVEQMIEQAKEPSVIVIAALVAVVAAPIAEELLFRGVLLGWFWKIRLPSRDRDFAINPEVEEDPEILTIDHNSYGAMMEIEPPVTISMPKDPFAGRGRHDLTANIAVSLIFAGLHASVWPTPVPLFFLSLVLGEIYRRTGSLVGPIVLHMTFNGLSTMTMILVSQAANGVVKP